MVSHHESFSASHSVLTSDEKELGVALVDIGAGTTDIAVYAQGAIRHTASLPIAGDQVTGDIAPLLDKMRMDLSSRWTIERMAAACRMSGRTFVRRFVEAAGVPPGEWLTSERLEAAKTLLRESDAGFDDVATAVGLGSAYGLRHHFRRRLGISPSDYRARFMAERTAGRCAEKA